MAETTNTSKPMSQSRKAKALLIALVNLNLVLAISTWGKIDATVATSAIQAIMFMAGLYMGVQGGIDFAAAWKADLSYKGQSVSTDGQASNSSKG